MKSWYEIMTSSLDLVAVPGWWCLRQFFGMLGLDMSCYISDMESGTSLLS